VDARTWRTPDRDKGTFAFDTNTQELARAIAAEFLARTGHHPHLVICRITRRKLDCNREIMEAAAGNKVAGQVWNEYHGFIDAAQKAVVAKYGKGFSSTSTATGTRKRGSNSASATTPRCTRSQLRS